MNRRWVPRAIGLPLLLLVGGRLPAGAARTGGSSSRASCAAAPASAEQALLNRYCAGCHNEKAKQGNFVLSTLDVANVGPDAERWELVVRKLRARSMPPAGRPRPTEAGIRRARSRTSKHRSIAWRRRIRIRAAPTRSAA